MIIMIVKWHQLTLKKVGIMHYNDLVYLADTEPTYKKRFQDNSINLLDYECYCCKQPGAGTSFIGDRVSEYNQVLGRVAKEVSGTLISDLVAPIMGKPVKNIAVVYQPMNTIIPTVPYNALRFVYFKLCFNSIYFNANVFTHLVMLMGITQMLLVIVTCQENYGIKCF